MPLQIERERADLSVQVIQLSERLEEAEGGAESQVSLKEYCTPVDESKENFINQRSPRENTQEFFDMLRSIHDDTWN